jgi:polar amino acid transport system substrate-binding protein
MFWRFSVVGMMGVAAPAAAAEQTDITMLFHVRPPYAYYDAAQDVGGLLVAPVMDALSEAGIAAEWIEMPPARQTEEIKRVKRAVCGLGWFKRPERETYAVFSEPIYRDQPTVVVARTGDTRFADGMSLQDSFRDASRTLLAKAGYSYGAELDEWIKTLHPTVERSSGANEVLLGMIAQRRADYAIMAPEEAEDLLGSVPELGASLRAVRLSDAPDGELRYLMCSTATPAGLVAAINDALKS